MTLDLTDPLFVRPLIESAACATLVLGTRRALLSRIGRNAGRLSRSQRYRAFHVRNITGALLVLGLALIWFAQLQSLLLSLTAVTVALVIATKELIQCAAGSLLRSIGGLFRIGYWIEIDGRRGEIVEHNLLTTTILEMDGGSFGYGFTGRSLVLPNSSFFTSPVRVQRFGRRFVSHRFSLVFETERSASDILGWWDRRAGEAVQPFEALARRYHRAVERRLGGEMLGPDPLVTLSTSEIGKLRIEVMLFCPTGKAMQLERTLKADFLDWLADVPHAASAASPVRLSAVVDRAA